MHRRNLLLATAGTALLAACSPSTPSSAPSQPTTLTGLLNEVKGFQIGQPLASRRVLVFFDTQCRFCAQLWEASAPLLSYISMVWAPVAILNAASLKQGVTILAAEDPRSVMDEHEKLFAQGRGGITAFREQPKELVTAVEANTKILGRFPDRAVPFLVAANPEGGGLRTHAGALSTAGLAQFLGVQV